MKIQGLLQRQWQGINQWYATNGRQRKLLFTLIAVGTTAAILGWLVYSQWDFLVSYSWDIQPRYLVLAFLVYSIILVFTIFTWSNILDRLGRKAPFATHFRSFCISALGKRLPGTLWYIAWRAQMYGDNFSARLVTIASGVEMAVTVIAAVVVSLVFAIPLITEYQYSIVPIVLLFLTSLLAIHPRVIAWVLKRLKVEANQLRYLDLLKWVGLYAVVYLLVGTLLWSIANMLTPTPLVYLGYFIGSSALTGVLSRLLLFSPSTFGFGEVSLSLLLSRIMPSSMAVIVAVSNRLIVISFEIIWALIAIAFESALKRRR